LTEDIAIRLSKFGELFVIASESAFAFKDNTTNPRDIGRRLGARYIVLGAVRPAYLGARILRDHLILIGGRAADATG